MSKNNETDKIQTHIPYDAHKMFALFSNFGYELYLVGGAVRDLFMGKIPHDYDFATNATPSEMRALIEQYNSNIKTKEIKIELIPTGERYGTLTFKIDKNIYEVTTYRGDGNYSDGRRPDEVVFSKCLQHDLNRRDFTMNAIAYNPTLGVTDPFNGIIDIQNKIVRTVGNPTDRFCEDALRIMRAIRFSYKLGFEIEQDTLDAVYDNLNRLENVSAERINSELVQILGHLNKNVNIEPFERLLEFLFHGFLARAFENFSDICDLNTILGKVLFINLPFYPSGTFCFINRLKELKFEKQFIKDFTLLSDKVEQPHVYTTLIEVKKLLSEIGAVNVAILITVWEKCWADFAKTIKTHFEEIISSGVPYTLSALEIDGNDIKALGVSGKAVGQYLSETVLYIWKFPQLNKRDILLEFIKTLYSKNKKKEI